MKDSDFNNSERPLIIEVAQRLEPRLGDIIRAWTEAVPLDAPPDKIPGMRRTLVELTQEFKGAFFHALTTGGPRPAFGAHDEFSVGLIRRDPPGTTLNRRLAIEDLTRASRLLREIVDREIKGAFGDKVALAANGRLNYARL